ASNEPAPDVPVGLQVNFAPTPGSLPRLRFGHSYRLRVRTVDLAGNSEPPPPPGSTDDSHATDLITYTRFDPVDVPVVVLRDVLTEGESLEQMVIRSNYDQTCDVYINSAPVQTAVQGKPYKAYKTVNDRHLAPPKTSQLMAETHGKFDASIGKFDAT